MVQVGTDGNSHPFYFMPRTKINWATLVAQIVKNLVCRAGDSDSKPALEDPLEKGMSTQIKNTVSSV